MKPSGFLHLFRFRSLKSVLAWYFVPISVVPVIVISLYATHVFEQNTISLVIQRAQSERQAILAEIETLEQKLTKQTVAQAAQLASSVGMRIIPRIDRVLKTFPPNRTYRVYEENGAHLTGHYPLGNQEQIPYVAQKAIGKVLRAGKTVGRFFVEGKPGFIILLRTLLRDKDRLPVGD